MESIHGEQWNHSRAAIRKPQGHNIGFPRLCRKQAILLALLLSLLLFPVASPMAQGTPAEAPAVVEPANEPVPELVAPSNGAAPQRIPDPFSAKRVILNELQQKSLTYKPGYLSDPFVPFITPQRVSAPELPLVDEDLELPPEPPRPLTPLQRMNLGEIEKGLRAIIWGELGRRAVIEDGSGKGYIVEVGTPAGDKNGMVAQIFNDHIVVQQESWDRKLKRMVPQNVTVKLKKEERQ